MAIEVLDEHEQSELVRNWLRSNGGWIFAGLVAGMGVIVGSNFYDHWRASQLDQAGSAYAEYLEAVDKKDQDQIKSLGAGLRSQHADSPYAVLSAMAEAQTIVAEGGDMASALDSLRWARKHAKLPELETLASLRLARAQLQTGALDEALSTVKEIQGKGFAAELAELHGDILAAQGQAAEAHAAYEEALVSMDATAARRSLVEMKRDDLALVSANTPAAAVEATKAGG
ncbi:MAG: YfgM family protein [Lysobacterales bacterium]